MKKIAILYQAAPPPVKDGIQKPMKLGGYSDSGADIAYALRKKGLPIITPEQKPTVENDFSWVFPDTKVGIQSAIDKGASIFWLNTVLFTGHSIEQFFESGIEIIGQLPKSVDIYDNKLATNKLLKKNGLSIPKAVLIKKNSSNNYQLKLSFPLVVKPIRGRGSQGISLATNQKELDLQLNILFKENKYGSIVYAEQFLIGQEITITVMPPGMYQLHDKLVLKNKHWSLPVVKRFNHENGIAPYSGHVAVINNSTVLNDDELNAKAIKEVSRQCEKAANIINAKAPIRIDCRADKNGKYFLFDLNMKPNMTGASRPHRQDQDSLSALAARKVGWTYSDLLINILNQKWTPKSMIK